MAHEIGHRPKRWEQYRAQRALTHAELHALCRHEETLADRFAGKALAEMNMSPEPLCEFLLQVQKKPHPDYLPAADRVEIIRDAHTGREYRATHREKMFPDYHRMSAPKGHLGDY